MYEAYKPVEMQGLLSISTLFRANYK